VTNVAELTPTPTPSQEMVTVTMTITPAQAREWLDKMQIQRRLRRSKVEKLKRQVQQGRWKLLPHGIVLDRDGRPIDGMHRLTMICELDCPLALRVTFNADPASIFTIDADGAPKDLQDALKLAGAPLGYVSELAAMTRMVWRADQGKSPLEPGLTPTNEEGVETYRRNPDLIEAAKLASKVRYIVPSRGLFGYYVYLAMHLDVQGVRDFVHRLSTGELLKAGDPALLVRNTYMKDRAQRVTRMVTDQAIIAATSLNAVLRKKSLYTWRGVEFGKGKVPAIGA
jgi:hypothetical protein